MQCYGQNLIWCFYNARIWWSWIYISLRISHRVKQNTICSFDLRFKEGYHTRYRTKTLHHNHTNEQATNKPSQSTDQLVDWPSKQASKQASKQGREPTKKPSKFTVLWTHFIHSDSIGMFASKLPWCKVWWVRNNLLHSSGCGCLSGHWLGMPIEARSTELRRISVG